MGSALEINGHLGWVTLQIDERVVFDQDLCNYLSLGSVEFHLFDLQTVVSSPGNEAVDQAALWVGQDKVRFLETDGRIADRMEAGWAGFIEGKGREPLLF